MLLILASVTISAVFGDNGIIRKAQEAANKINEAIVSEQEELNELYNELENAMGEGEKIVTVVEDLKEGDWVNYVDGTGTIRKCVVLYGPENEKYSSYGIQIITMKSVEVFVLGEIGTNDETKFNKNRELYNDVINYLNNATQKYLNITYAKSVRCVGSVPDNPSYDEAGIFNSSYSYMEPYNGTFKDTSNNTETDCNQMEPINAINIDENYWLAMRVVLSDEDRTWFYANFMMPFVGKAGIAVTQMCRVESNGDIYAGGAGIASLRPVFTLQFGIKVIGGDGTEASPYKLGV